MAYKFNPFTGALDQTGAAGGDNNYYSDNLWPADPNYANLSLGIHADGNFNDHSTNLLVPTVYGNTAITNVSRFGSGSIEFDGSTDYIRYAFDTALDLFSASAWTISFWMKPDVAAGRRIMGSGSGFQGWNLTDGLHWILITSGTNGDQVNFQWKAGVGNAGVTSAVSSVSTSTWTHVAVTWDGTTIRLFTNGNLDDSSTVAFVRPSLDPYLDLGTIPGEGAYPTGYDGLLDEIYIYKGVAVWTANFTPPTSPLGTTSSGGLVSLDALSDVDTLTTPPTDGQVLAWNNANSQWKPNTINGSDLTFSAGTAALPGIAFNGDPNTGIYSPGADIVGVSTAGTERLRIDSSGRLLVGTSTATRNIRDNQRLAIVGTASTGIYTGLALTTYGGAGSGPTAILDFQRSNGTVDQSMTSCVLGDRTGLIRFSGSNGTSFATAADIQSFVDIGTVSGTSMPGRLVFSTTANGASSPTERMRITQNGVHFHYGATTAGIFSTAQTGSGVTAAFAIRNSATSTTSGTDSLYIFPNGNVQNTNNSYGAISDIKLKENIVAANSQWNDLKALQVRNYNFKEGQTHTQIGLIAQEVELVSPGLVTESPDRDEDGNDLGTVTKSVNYSVLYMKAVKALQEAMERIETLEAKVAALEAQ
jgi:hypothetical protein